MAKYRGHKYENITIRADAQKRGKKIISHSPHKRFHKTLNTITMGTHAQRLGQNTPGHKKFAKSYGYKPRKLMYKRLPGKIRKHRSG